MVKFTKLCAEVGLGVFYFDWVKLLLGISAVYSNIVQGDNYVS
jgi:hypothetical protein